MQIVFLAVATAAAAATRERKRHRHPSVFNTIPCDSPSIYAQLFCLATFCFCHRCRYTSSFASLVDSVENVLCFCLHIEFCHRRRFEGICWQSNADINSSPSISRKEEPQAPSLSLSGRNAVLCVSRTPKVARESPRKMENDIHS